jgi:hypothetical protein
MEEKWRKITERKGGIVRKIDVEILVKNNVKNG